jgi:hypothetical protein
MDIYRSNNEVTGIVFRCGEFDDITKQLQPIDTTELVSELERNRASDLSKIVQAVERASRKDDSYVALEGHAATLAFDKIVAFHERYTVDYVTDALFAELGEVHNCDMPDRYYPASLRLRTDPNTRSVRTIVGGLIRRLHQ